MMKDEIKNKTFLVVGTGISGVAAAKLLSSKGASIIVLDGNDKLKQSEVRGRFPNTLKFELILGELPQNWMDEIDIAVLSPGVPIDNPLVENLKKHNVEIWGEIELAYRLAEGRMFAITGTNGKTTTTALTGEILNAYFKEVFVVGNIGLPYTEYASDMTVNSVTVAEVSSFQLETISSFEPEVCAILNITPDHLDRHHTMENYINAKLRIAMNQNKNQVCVMNYDDEILRKVSETLASDIFWFSSTQKLERGVWLEGEQIYYSNGVPDAVTDGSKIPVCTIHDTDLMGRHNYENVMAAIAITAKAGVPIDSIREGICKFRAVEHRIEYVREVRGVKYYNDSKGTNPDAAIKAVRAMVRPTVLIGGGYDKNSDYNEWISSFGSTVKCLVLMGATKEKIANAAIKAGFTNVVMVEDLKEAVHVCSNAAKPGDAVLLSPACASWDMFTNFEERGNLFKQYVNELK